MFSIFKSSEISVNFCRFANEMQVRMQVKQTEKIPPAEDRYGQSIGGMIVHEYKSLKLRLVCLRFPD